MRFAHSGAGRADNLKRKTKLRLAAAVLALTAVLSASCGGGGHTGNGTTAGTKDDSDMTTKPNIGPVTDPADTAREWVEKQIENDTLFTFSYGGKAFSAFIGSWKKETGERKQRNDTIRTLKYTSPDGVTAEATVTLRADFPSVEWVCRFGNTSGATSEAVSQINVIDSELGTADMTLTYPRGSYVEEAGVYDGFDDFERLDYDFTKTSVFRSESTSGRSTSKNMPYFDLHNGNGGVIATIGWTGTWSCRITKGENSMSMRAGMSLINTVLYAGEEMRTPSMLLMFYSGDQDDGHNLWRRLILNHYSPKDGSGEPVRYTPIFLGAGYADTGERGILGAVNKVKSGIAAEGIWIDASWYGTREGTDWYSQAGNWYLNKSLYPNGFAATKAAVKNAGLELLMWFEPERAFKNTKLYTDHPDWFIGPDNDSQALFDFTNDDAVEYMINFISGMLNDCGVTWYRQDFNISPASYWTANDGKSSDRRVGMTEVKYITGLYHFLDGITENVPGLMIDNCAGGGRRLDIEMLKRSIVLWESDNFCGDRNPTAEGTVNMNMNLSYWMPVHSGGMGSSYTKSRLYEYRCAYATGLQFHETGDRTFADELLTEYREIRGYFADNFYILSQGTPDKLEFSNYGYMCMTDDGSEGFLMLIHPARSMKARQTFVLKGLDAGGVYELVNADSDDVTVVSGSDLMEKGIDIRFPNTDSAKLFSIKKR